MKKTIMKLVAAPGKFWQSRFLYGFSIDGPGVACQRYTTGEKMFYVSLLNIVSAGTGHWPFKLFEVKLLLGRFFIWHVCICGLIVGQSMKHDLDAEGNVEGPDKRYTYWAFSALNHQNKEFGEVI